MMRPFPAMTTKATPPTRSEALDKELDQLEIDFTEAIAAALDARRRALFNDVTDDNAETELTTRLHDPDHWQPLTDTIAKWLQRIADNGVTFGIYVIEKALYGTVKAVPAAVDWSLANAEAAEWALQAAAGLVGEMAMNTTPRIQAEVANWIRNKESVKELAQRIQGGYLYSASRAEAIAITEVTRAYSYGNRAAWRSSGVVTEIRWRTANDEKVCPICAPMEDTVTEVQGGQFEHPGGQGDRQRWGGSRWAQPPAHTRCRCWLAPVVREIELDLTEFGL